jgi:uncharacterized membrane protein YdfJ with MMPL/SSD domain
MIPRLVSLIVRFPWLLVVIAILLAGTFGWYGRDVQQHLTLNPGWDAPGTGSARAVVQLRDQLGREETPVIVLFSPRPGSPLLVANADYRRAVESALASLSGNPEVGAVLTYYSTGDPRLRSADGRMTYAVVNLNRGIDEGVAAFQRLRAALGSDTLDIRLGGELAVYVDVREQLDRDLKRAEIVSFIALAVLLMWVFGSLVAAALPLIIGGATILASVALLKGATHFTEISVYAPNVVSMLGLGLAVDYSLFIVSRFREELAAERAMPDALRITMLTAGRSVVYSGLTVAGSLFCLFLLPQRFFHNMGLAGGISVGAALLSSIVLLPALLALLGERINSLTPSFLAHRLPGNAVGARWYAFSHFVMRHARVILLATLVILAILGLPVKDMRVGPADSRSLPQSAQSRQVQETLMADFPANELAPLLVLVRTRNALTAADSLAALHALTAEISADPAVTRVSGLLTLDPGLTLADYQMLYQYPEQFPPAAEALAALSKDRTTLLYVFYTPDPTSAASRDLVARLRDLPHPAGLEEVVVGGFPAFHLDYLGSLRDGVPKVVAAIIGVICVLLFFMLGSVTVPIKVVLTSLLSMSATFGALVWIIQEGHFSTLLGFTPQGSLDGTILVLVFASAFGLSIDYEVFLLSRVKEMCDATHGDSFVSVSTGIQRSGPIITNAALLIGIVLGAFAMGEVVFIKAIGLGLLLSVLVDATLVRMLLVPATLRIMGRFNWWAPKPLLMVYQRFNLSETGNQPKQEGKT